MIFRHVSAQLKLLIRKKSPIPTMGKYGVRTQLFILNLFSLITWIITCCFLQKEAGTCGSDLLKDRPRSIRAAIAITPIRTRSIMQPPVLITGVSIQAGIFILNLLIVQNCPVFVWSPATKCRIPSGITLKENDSKGYSTFTGIWVSDDILTMTKWTGLNQILRLI